MKQPVEEPLWREHRIDKLLLLHGACQGMRPVPVVFFRFALDLGETALARDILGD